MRIAFIGSSDLATLAAHHAEQIGYDIVGYFDDFKPVGVTDNGLRILGKLNDVKGQFGQGQFDGVFIAIGYNFMDFRKSVYEQMVNDDIPILSIISKSTFVDASVKLGNGCFLLPGVTIDANTVLRNNIVLNTGATVAHDCRIDDHCFLGPGVKLAGFVNIGEQSFIGIGSILIDNLTICPKTQTGGGTVIIRSTEKPGLYLGVPGMFKR